jgi:dTDP-L-rhamnose 4-epimerase
MKILLTGSKGFIGSHVLARLKDHKVDEIDSMEYQVHGWTGSYKKDRAGEAVFGTRDIVIHLAALVGVGQSMYEPARYVECNSLDSARFLENLTKNKPKRLVVASSMSVYGEGAIPDAVGQWDKSRTANISKWNGSIGTNEFTRPQIESVYALTKYDQEQLCLIWGKANGVEVVALRFFNTWGPNQALNNPYTGVLTIFANRLLNGKAPIIFEDGQQTRDFVHVDDVANAVVHAATNDIPSGVYNVGTGIARTIESVALDLAEAMGSDIKPEITGKMRAGDIRHCYADIDKIRATGWAPAKDWKAGLLEYVQWLKTQPRPKDDAEKAIAELEERGLLK